MANVNIIFIGKDQVSKVMGGIGKEFGKLNKIGASVAKGLAGGLAVAGGAVAAGLASSIKEGAAFTKQMSNVGALAAKVPGDLEKLTSTAKKMGATTAFSATEAAEGMQFLAQAGFEVDDIITSLPGVLDLAAASNLDLGSAADIVSNIMSGFGAKADKTGQFVDIMTSAISSSNTDMEQMGAAMKFVGPVAKGLGLDVADTAAVIGKLSDAGIQGAMAGNRFKSVLQRLISPTAESQKVMEELGISVFDAQGNMLPFPNILDQISSATANMTQEQREVAKKTLVTGANVASLNVLLDVGGDAITSYADQLRNDVGRGADIASKQLDNLSGDVTLFQSALSGVKIEVFSQLEPILRMVVQSATGLLTTALPRVQEFFEAFRIGSLFIKSVLQDGDLMNDWLVNLPPAFQGPILKIGEFVLLIQGLVASIGPAITQASSFFSEHFEIIKTAVTTVVGLLAGSVMSAAITWLIGALGALLSPIGLITAAVIALRVGWINNWGGIRDIISNLWDNTLKPVFMQIVTWFKRTIPIAIEIVKGFFVKVLAPALQQVADFISTNLPLAIAFLTKMWTETLLPALREVWTFFQANILPILTALGNLILSFLVGELKLFAAIWTNILLPAVKIVWKFFLTTLLPILKTLGEWLGANLPGAIATLQSLWENVLLPAMIKVYEWIGAILIPLMSLLFEKLSRDLPEGVRRFSDFWTNILLPAITTVWKFIQSPLLPLFATLFEWLSTTLPEGLKKLSDFWTNILLPAITTVWEFIQNPLFSLFDILFGWVATTFPEGLKKLSDFWTNILLPAITTVWEFIQNPLLSLFDILFGRLSTDLPEGLKTLSDFWTNILLPAITTVWEFIQNPLFSLFDILFGWIGLALPEGLKTLSDSWAGTLLSAITAVWKFIQESVIPAFETLVNWFQNSIPSAIQKMANFWTNILKPALATVWQFITNLLIPIFETLVNWLNDNLPKAINFVTKAWRGLNNIIVAVNTAALVLRNIFQSIAKFFERGFEKGVRVFIDVMSRIRGMLTRAGIAFQDFKNKVNQLIAPLVKIQNRISSIFASISSVTGKIRNAVSTSRSVSRPSPSRTSTSSSSISNSASEAARRAREQLAMLEKQARSRTLATFMPGSPTPFEMGLRGIANAFKNITVQAAPFFNLLDKDVNLMSAVGNRDNINNESLTNNQFTLNLNSSAPTENMSMDFEMMQSRLAVV
jgi:TP901 family phage tail tape measure protein